MLNVKNSMIQSLSFPGNLSTKLNRLVFSSAEIFFQTDSSEENSVCTVGKSLSIPANDLDKSAPLSRDDVGLSQVDDEEMEVSGDGNHSIISNTRPVFAEPVNSDSPESNNDNTELQKPFVGAFKILGDEEDGDCMEIEEPMEVSCQHAWPISHTSTKTRINSFDNTLKEDTVFRRLKEDTVIRKIVGSKVFDEPKVENACHHGLVDPTVNLKQAIDDINDMFGKTLNFGKVHKPKKQENHAFFILPDDDIMKKDPPCISHSSNGEISLFEPTLFTKEAMNEINDLFGKPLDF